MFAWIGRNLNSTNQRCQILSPASNERFLTNEEVLAVNCISTAGTYFCCTTGESCFSGYGQTVAKVAPELLRNLMLHSGIVRLIV